jgi:hypothetical protein
MCGMALVQHDMRHALTAGTVHRQASGGSDGMPANRIMPPPELRAIARVLPGQRR